MQAELEQGVGGNAGLFVVFGFDVAVDGKCVAVVCEGGSEGLRGEFDAVLCELVCKLDEECVSAGEVIASFVDGSGECFLSGEDVIYCGFVCTGAECHELDGLFEFAVDGGGHFAFEPLAGGAFDGYCGGEAVQLGEELVFEVVIEDVGCGV